MSDKYQTIKIRKSAHTKLKVRAAENDESLLDLIERLARNDGAVASYRERKLIAHVQALIAAHRYPAMYQVEKVIEDAEAAWKEANDRLLDVGL